MPIPKFLEERASQPKNTACPLTDRRSFLPKSWRQQQQQQPLHNLPNGPAHSYKCVINVVMKTNL